MRFARSNRQGAMEGDVSGRRIHRIIVGSLLLAAASFTSSATAFDVPLEGDKVTAKSEPVSGRRRFVFRGFKDSPGFPNPNFNETTVVATEVICPTMGAADDFCVPTATSGAIVLDPTLWTGLGNPPGSKGYRYHDSAGSRGGVRAALVRQSGKFLVKAVGDDWPLAPTGTGTGIQVKLTSGSIVYCADFGGTEKRNEAGFVSYYQAAPAQNCGAACGNGVVENGEGCDPPNGTTCDPSCRLSCANEIGSTLIACSSSDDPSFGFAGNGDTFVLAYTQVAPEGTNTRAVRLDSLGQALDAPPLVLSDGAFAASEPLAIVDDNGFYALWSSASASYGQKRRIPFAGLALGPTEPLGTNPPTVGMCFQYLGGPFGLGASLANDQPHFSTAATLTCVGVTWLTGVPGAGSNLTIPPFGADQPPASYARSNSAVAAVWTRVIGTTPLSYSIHTNRIEPGTLPSPLQLTTAPGIAGTPVVAAVGNLFMAVWTTSTQIRGLRFMFPNTVLDPAGGFQIAAASGSAGLPVVTSDGVRFIVAWRDRNGVNDELRLVHVGTDGTVEEATPAIVASADAIEDIGLAAGTTSAWVAFSTAESSGAYAMRIAEVP